MINNKLLFSLFLLVIGFIAFAGSGEDYYPVQIPVKKIEEFGPLYRLKIDIDDVRRGIVRAYVNDQQFEQLQSLGYGVVRIPNRAKEFADSLWEATKDSRNPLDEYHTYQELTAELQQIAQDNPDICQLFSIGQSVLGRELWFMKISDSVGTEEPEPEFKYISTMHGDEPVGMELCLYLINYLVDNYGVDSLVTRLVNETEIWIMPLMNPDGYVAHRRYNANNVDLNRDFPDHISDPNNTPAGREPETQAVMGFGFTHSSVLSANFHGGALVVNYPYDSAVNSYPHYEACPDDSLFITISEAYSIHNQPMWNGSFYHGITNGAAWYVIYGGMQDWNYVWMGDNEVTIEVSNIKWPLPSALPGLWEDNREAMLAYMELVHSLGIRGMVTDVETGEPLGATIRVLGIDHNVYTDPDVGDYYRMLLPGSYAVQFTSDGYTPYVAADITVLEGVPTRVDASLYPQEPAQLQGTVTEAGTGEPLRAIVEILYSEIPPTETDSATGTYTINLDQGMYRVKASADGYVPALKDSLIITGVTTWDFQLDPYRVFYYTQSQALIIPDGDPLGAASPLSIPDSLQIGDINVFVDIGHQRISDLKVDLISPLGTVVTLHNHSGGSASNIVGWYDTDFPVDGPGTLGDFGGQGAAGSWTLKITDTVPGQEGRLYTWGLEIFTLDTVLSSPEDDKSRPQGFHLSQNYPNPFNASTVIGYRISRKGPVTLKVFNLLGQEVANLADGVQSPGVYRIVYQPTELAGGVYFYRLRVGGRVMTKKMVYVR